ncbi:MAG TPA: glutaredoxin family protein [Polyangia bacterium]|jgi:glutaredoxin
MSGKTALAGIGLLLVVGGGLLAYLHFGAARPREPAARTLPELVIGRGRQLRFTFADAGGALQTVGTLDEVPAESRDCVQVVDERLQRADRTAALVYVADLRDPPVDGRVPHRVLPASQYPALVLPQSSVVEMKMAYEPERAPAPPVPRRRGKTGARRSDRLPPLPDLPPSPPAPAREPVAGAPSPGGFAGGSRDVPDLMGGAEHAAGSARAALARLRAGAPATGAGGPAPVAAAAPRRAAAGAHRVTLYATSWCPACTQARAFLSGSGVAYTERDIERDPAASAEYARKCRAIGQRTGRVPGIDVDGRLMIGFAPGRLASLLGL